MQLSISLATGLLVALSLSTASAQGPQVTRRGSTDSAEQPEPALGPTNPSGLPRWTLRPELPAPSRARRLGAELVGAGLAVGATIGGTLGAIRATECSDVAEGSYCISQTVGAIVGIGAFAAPPIISLGVWSAGRLAGGQGRYDFTLLGSALGNALGWVALGGLARSDSDAAFGVGMALVPLLQSAGAILGYELSHRAESGHDRRLGPTIQADRNGGTLGVAGTF